MADKKHEHISHGEIAKYLSFDEESFFLEDPEFFKGFDDRVNECETCAKRFRLYLLLDKIKEGASE
jgi:hypothetical protein